MSDERASPQPRQEEKEVEKAAKKTRRKRRSTGGSGSGSGSKSKVTTPERRSPRNGKKGSSRRSSKGSGSRAGRRSPTSRLANSGDSAEHRTKTTKSEDEATVEAHAGLEADASPSASGKQAEGTAPGSATDYVAEARETEPVEGNGGHGEDEKSSDEPVTAHAVMKNGVGEEDSSAATKTGEAEHPEDITPAADDKSIAENSPDNKDEVASEGSADAEQGDSDTYQDVDDSVPSEKELLESAAVGSASDKESSEPLAAEEEAPPAVEQTAAEEPTNEKAEMAEQHDRAEKQDAADEKDVASASVPKTVESESPADQDAASQRKEKNWKKRMSLIGGFLASRSTEEEPLPLDSESVELNNALINAGGSMGLGQMKFVGSPRKLQKKVLKKQHQKFIQADVAMLKNNIVHGWYVDCSCGLKGVNVDDGKKMMQCDVCKAWQHCKCNGLSTSTEEQRARLKSKKVWVCQFCKLGRYKFQGYFWKYDRKAEIRQLKADQAKLEESIEEAQASASEENRSSVEAEAEADATEEPSASTKPALDEEPAETELTVPAVAVTPAPAGPGAAVRAPTHTRSRSVEFSRKVVVHRILSVQESEAARENAKQVVLANSTSLRSILRIEPQEFTEGPDIPTPMDMLEKGQTLPLLSKKSSFSRVISRRLPKIY